MKKILLALAFCVSALVLPVSPANALTNCTGNILYQKWTSFGSMVQVQDNITYRRCDGPSGNPVADVISWKVEWAAIGSDKDKCNEPFGIAELDYIVFDPRITDLAGHSINPASRTMFCQTDGYNSYTWGSTVWDATTFRVDQGAQWTDNIKVVVRNGPDQSVTHTGGFPLSP